jgi:hypothetical protein
LVAAPNGTQVLRQAVDFVDTAPEEAGGELAARLLSQGARELLKTSH